ASGARGGGGPPAGGVGAASRGGWDAGVGRCPQPAAAAAGHHRARPAPPRAPHGPASSMRRDMIRMRTDFFAESLGMGTSMVVLMPQAAAGIGMAGADGGSSAAREDRGVPVLYLLHGL